MDGWILVVDSNSGNYTTARTDWAKYNISICFTASMEQIFKHLDERDYLLVVVIADNLDYLSRLRELVEAVTIPVLVLSTGYSHTEKLAAMKAGVIAYLGDMVFETAVPCAWFLICQLHQPRHRGAPRLSFSTYRNILLCKECLVVFVAGKQVILTGKEFALLEYLMDHAGLVLSYTQIYEEVWQREDYGQSKKLVANLVFRLRQMLAQAIPADSLIKAVRDTGYKIDIY